MKKEKLLIIGGLGYIGSFLSYSLDSYYDINIVDLNLFNFKSSKKHPVDLKDFKNLKIDFLKKFDHIILLAGHSSVRMCDGKCDGVFHNNVSNFINLVENISPNQTFIYASSASVYGNSKKNIVNEKEELSFPYNMYDLTKQVIDSYILTNKFNNRIFGLRFGTVNGCSPHLRNDVMLNSMVYNAVHNNEILLYNSKTKRAILGINDLQRAVKRILVSTKSNCGIYNLSSFTNTAGEMALQTSKILNVKVKKVNLKKNIQNVNEKLISSKYNFGLDCSLFKNDFNFSFKDNLYSIVTDLKLNLSKMYITNRNGAFNYEYKL